MKFKQANEFKDGVKLLGFNRVRWNDGNEGDGAGSGDKGEGSGVSKEDFISLQEKYNDAISKLDDMRLEVMSQDYIDFINAKDTGASGKEEKKEVDTGKGKESASEGVDFEKMSKAELVKHIKDEMKNAVSSLEQTFSSKDKENVKLEVRRFAATHEDFSTYRPIMYGLSLDPKNKDLSLAELYEKSKEHVKRIHTEPSDEAKAKSRKASNEKPGGASRSFDSGKKYSAEEAASEAFDEIEKELGPMPSA